MTCCLLAGTGVSALHGAIAMGQTGVVGALLEKGAKGSGEKHLAVLLERMEDARTRDQVETLLAAHEL